MNKFFLTLVAAATMSVGALAQITVPAALNAPMTEANDLEGWITYGNNAEPAGAIAAEFTDYATGPWFHVTTFGGVTAAYSASVFTDSSVSDQWLITPEFTITDENVLVRYEAVAYSTKSKTKFKLLLSEGGTAKEDFTTVVQDSKSITPTQSSTPFAKGFGAAISGMKGKKVRLAFVNADNKVGVLGFRNITVGGYSLTFDTPEELLKKPIRSNDPYFSTVVRVSTPVMTSGITATLETELGQKLEFSNTLKLNSSLATMMTIKFDKAIDFEGKSSVNYTLTIKPNSDTEVEPTVVKGVLNYVEMKYDLPLVIEELTGTWCQYCPYGAAFMGYYADKYNGLDGNKKVIAVAVHSGDVMAVSSYEQPLSSALAAVGFSGYPFMGGNRAMGSHPASFPISSVINNTTFAKAEISRVDYDPSQNQLAKVSFNTTLSYDTMEPDFNMSVVVIENDVMGNSRDYDQTVAAAIASMTENDVKRQYGEDMVPYFEPFIGLQISSGVGTASYKTLAYNEVARGIYPSFEGNAVKGAFEAEKPVNNSISFSMPGNVMKPENVKVIVLLTDQLTGRIIAADELGFDEFNKDITHDDSAVSAVNAGNSSMTVRNGYVVINADSEGVATIYATDGRMIANTAVVEGENVISLNGFKGIAIVKANTSSGIVAGKVIL